MKKKLLSIFTAAAMSIPLALPFTASAQESIKVGDYVKMGTYYDAPIIWRCVDVDENGQLMISDKIIMIKAYDAAGMTAVGSHTRYQTRRTVGSNYWGDSNIRTWLNSEAEEGKIDWPDKNPPIKSQMSTGYNEYRTEAGFLNAFTPDELKAIKRVSQKTIAAEAEINKEVYDTGSELLIWNSEAENVVQNYDNAYAEYFADTVFLPDIKQLNTIYKNSEILGEDYYIGEPTAEAVSNSDYQNASFAKGEKWTYWLRTPYTFWHEAISVDGGTLVRYVSANGTIGNASANTDTIGIRPAFYLNTATMSVNSGSGTADNPYIVTGNGITVLLNGADITFDQPPANISDRVMVPIRAIFEAMGYTVDWNEETQTAAATNGEDKISVGIGKSDISYTTGGTDGTYTCDVAPQIVSGRTLVPVRAISESAGCAVDWNGDTQTVIITK